MVKLDQNNYPVALALYRSTGAFFPLIAAVLLNDQDGSVYADDNTSPRQVYVEHVFGFAQIFGTPCAGFEAELEQYLLTDRRFAAPKVRLYTPHLPAFLDRHELVNLRSFRQRFFIDLAGPIKEQLAAPEQSGQVRIVTVDELNIAEVEHVFGIVCRFWRNPADFIHRANAVVALYRDRPVSICYSAAEADRRVEIDVLTLPECRGLGVGKITVTHFIKRCLEQSLEPLWDCFSNNAGSVNLCRSVGFHAPCPPYPFFTINR
ncbi:MAG: GNAT family N-acetyltransferase [Syntrophobacteraceae bacterium]